MVVPTEPPSLDPVVLPQSTGITWGAFMEELVGLSPSGQPDDSGLLTSLDLVELNPFLDDRGRTAQVMVDLTASALGRRVFDRPTHSFAYERAAS